MPADLLSVTAQAKIIWRYHIYILLLERGIQERSLHIKLPQLPALCSCDRANHADGGELRHRRKRLTEVTPSHLPVAETHGPGLLCLVTMLVRLILVDLVEPEHSVARRNVRRVYLHINTFRTQRGKLPLTRCAPPLHLVRVPSQCVPGGRGIRQASRRLPRLRLPSEERHSSVLQKGKADLMLITAPIVLERTILAVGV